MSAFPAGLAVAVLLVFANAFFVAAEYALVRVRETQLRRDAERGDRLASLGLAMVRSLDEYVSAIQVGVTAASLGLGYVAEPVVFALIDELLAPADALSFPLLHGLSFASSFVLVTFVTLVFGELAPKYITLGNPLIVLRLVAVPLAIFRAFVRPFVWIVRLMALAVVRPFGVRSASAAEAYSGEELRLVVSAAARAGTLTTTEETIVRSAFGFADTPVRNVMMPRTDVAAVEATRSIDEFADLVRRRGFTRYPVYRGTMDQIVGVAHVRDALAVPVSEWPKARVAEIMRRVIPVPEQMGLDGALETMRTERTTLLLVVDEFGGTSGFVTLEDIVGELVGEVRDEFDRTRDRIRPEPDGTFLASGGTPLDEVNERFGLELRAGDYATLGGLLLDRLGRIADAGDSVEVDGARFEVTARDRRRVTEVRVHLAQPR